MFDDTGGVWLLEVNRMPGLTAYEQNLQEMEELYQDMLVDMFDLIILPAVDGRRPRVQSREECTATDDTGAPRPQRWRSVNVVEQGNKQMEVRTGCASDLLNALAFKKAAVRRASSSVEGQGGGGGGGS